MPDPLKWKVDKVVPASRPNEDGSGFVQQKRVIYHIGPHGPFEFTLDDKDFTGDTLRRLLNEQLMHFRVLFPDQG